MIHAAWLGYLRPPSTRDNPGVGKCHNGRARSLVVKLDEVTTAGSR